MDQVEDELLGRAPDFILTRTLPERAPVDFASWDIPSWGMAPACSSQRTISCSHHGETWARMTDLIHRSYQLDS